MCSINKMREIYKRIENFTLMELLVTISIMIILISILVPALTNAKATVRKIACASNLKQFGIANNMYVNDNNGGLPFSETDNKLWDYLLMDYLNYDYVNCHTRKDFSIFHCPAGIPRSSVSAYRSMGYGYNIYSTRYPTYPDMYRLATIQDPSITALMTDLYINIVPTEGACLGGTTNPNNVSQAASSGYISYRHLNQTNVLFADFHVKQCGKGSLSSYDGWRPSGVKWYNEGTVY